MHWHKNVSLVEIRGSYARLSLALAYATVVVGEGIALSVLGRRGEHSARPAEGCAVVVGKRIADCVVGYRCTVKGGKLVAPLSRAVSVGVGCRGILLFPFQFVPDAKKVLNYESNTRLDKNSEANGNPCYQTNVNDRIEDR